MMPELSPCHFMLFIADHAALRHAIFHATPVTPLMISDTLTAPSHTFSADAAHYALFCQRHSLLMMPLSPMLSTRRGAQQHAAAPLQHNTLLQR